jgi:hypothetical protein
MSTIILQKDSSYLSQESPANNLERKPEAKLGRLEHPVPSLCPIAQRRVSTTLRQVLTEFSEFFICSIRVSSFHKKFGARIA